MSTKKAGCFCGNVRVSITGEPAAHVLCHCLDCRKISGSTYSNNIIIPDDNFKLEAGTPKTISKIADTGKQITSHFCGDCGTTLFRTGDSFPKQYIVKSGIMDDPDWPGKNVPKGELFASQRISWVPAIGGADQVSTM